MDKELISRMITEANEARKKARVVKSGFHVGAAVLTTTGEIISGCNVEIENTLMSICAERSAIVKAVSMGYQDFTAIAVVSDSSQIVSPCGVCRQFLLDFGSDIKVYMSNCDGDKYVETTVGGLLPYAFLGSKKIRNGEK